MPKALEILSHRAVRKGVGKIVFFPDTLNEWLEGVSEDQSKN